MFIIDLAIVYGIDLRLKLCSGENELTNFLLWIITAVIFLLLATSVGKYIAPEADGSGIPEVKTVLSGINIYRCFSVETFVAKVIGILAGLIGGKYKI